MSGMPFNLTGKGALEAIAAHILVGEGQDEGDVFWNGTGHKRKKGQVLEPKSVLYHRRSPSPPISTSTLSSSLSGGGGSTDTGGVAAVSENPPHKWPVSDSISPSATFSPVDAGGRKEEWAAELQSITGLAEVGGLAVSSEKCGIGIEDWETVFSTSASSTSQEQTFLRWIMSDMDDPPTLKHHHHQPVSSEPLPVEFDAASTGPGFGLVDPIYGFETLGGIPSVAASAMSTSPSAIGTVSLPLSNVFYQSSRNHCFTAPSQPLSSQLSLLPGGKSSTFVRGRPGVTSPPPSYTPGMFFPEPAEEKPHHLAPNFFRQNHSPPNTAFFPQSSSFNAPTELDNFNPLPHPKRLHSIPSYSSYQIPATDAEQLQLSPYQIQQRTLKPRPSAAGDEAAMALQQQQGLVDQLFKASELVEAGNFISAHGILARLNHHLPSPLGKPLLRVAFYFKEALQLLIANSSNLPPSPTHHHRTPFTTPLVTPLDVVLKLSSYKAFSEVSPLLHFTNFTVTQALLEELCTANYIHIIDFDIGIGGQWSSFMQELAQQRRSSPVRMLKITAFVSFRTFHSLELLLARQNLTHFAAELNIPFEINISNIESFDPAEILATSASTNETIAVNLPVGSGLSPSFSTLLCLVKQLMPKIVVSIDQGCDRSDLPFSHHFLHAFQSSMVLLDSIDAAGSNLDMVNKIERFVLQPRIENCIIGRHLAADKVLQWRALFASAGFVPVHFSNFTEMQADCLLKRVQIRGFHVEKRQASLYLYWQRGELVSVSAWSC